MYPIRPPVKNVATGLEPSELALLREAINTRAPDLAFLLTDTVHELTLPEADRLVEAIADELMKCVTPEGEPDERGQAFDDLIGRVNLGPFIR